MGLELANRSKWVGHWVGPGAQEAATDSDPGLIHAHQVFQPGFF